MTFGDVGVIIALLFGSGGVVTAFVSIWSSRHKPQIDRQQAEDASAKTKADVFATSVDGLIKILDEHKEAREADRKEYNAKLAEQDLAIKNLQSRVAAAEVRGALVDTAIGHILVLENHIIDQKPPPPPKRPGFLTDHAPKET